MPLVKKLVRIGNSRGIILPQPILDQLDWQDAEIELKVSGNNLIVAPASQRYATTAEFQAAMKKVFSKHSRMNHKLAEG
jgi:antitoxin component of MazEF toxin-antitoxin module